jgi:hypothetical protein
MYLRDQKRSYMKRLFDGDDQRESEANQSEEGYTEVGSG